MNEKDLLQQLCLGPVSGDVLARHFGVSRAAVWKRVEALREAGVAVEAVAGRGYRIQFQLELLDAEQIRGGLQPAWAAGLSSCEVVWSLDSTNSELLRREAPASGVAVLLAERQLAGRGRRGRHWASPLAANLYLSLSRRFSGGLGQLGGLSLVAGVAIAEALHDLDMPGTGLKWPNDLVVDGRKLGGLLVEGSGEPAGAARAVIGLGLNVRMPASSAAAIDQPWIDVVQLLGSRTPSRNHLASAILDRLLPALALFEAEGLAPFLPRYAACDALLGREVAIHGGNGTQTGLASGIAPDGALCVRMGGQERHFHSGEVTVRAA